MLVNEVLFRFFVFLGIKKVVQRPTWAFFHLLNNALRAGTLRFYPRPLHRVEHFGQASRPLPANGGVDASAGFPDDGDLAVGVFFCDVFHDSALFEVTSFFATMYSS